MANVNDVDAVDDADAIADTCGVANGDGVTGRRVDNDNFHGLRRILSWNLFSRGVAKKRVLSGFIIWFFCSFVHFSLCCTLFVFASATLFFFLSFLSIVCRFGYLLFALFDYFFFTNGFVFVLSFFARLFFSHVRYNKCWKEKDNCIF